MGPPSFLAEWWPSGPRRQGFADAAQHAPLTAPCRSANPPLERKVELGRQVKIYLTWTGILMDTHAGRVRTIQASPHCPNDPYTPQAWLQSRTSSGSDMSSAIFDPDYINQ